MGRTDFAQLPRLGLGMMRLPLKNGQVDMKLVNQMVDYYMGNGFNYFDTAYVYHEEQSEGIVKKSVVERYPRENFFVADKLPGWEIKQASDVQRLFDLQLARTGVEYFDFFLLHSITKENRAKYDDYHCWEWGQEMKKKGLIKYFGFSFHGSPTMLEDLLSKHPEVDFVQLQLNYADWKHPEIASEECYQIARRHNLPIIVMEPVKGGLLADLHSDLMKEFEALRPQDRAVKWALRFVGSLEGVVTVLSGMSNLEQVAENIDIMKDFEELTDQEREVIEKVRIKIENAPTVACTACKYCVEGCPAAIKIPEIIKVLNTHTVYGNDMAVHQSYQQAVKDGGKAGDCIECGACESVCPQHLEIIKALAEAAEVFE